MMIQPYSSPKIKVYKDLNVKTSPYILDKEEFSRVSDVYSIRFFSTLTLPWSAFWHWPIMKLVQKLQLTKFVRHHLIYVKFIVI